MVAAALALGFCLGGVLLATHGEILARAFHVSPQAVRTIPTPRCPVPVIDASAESALSQVRLATGVRDLARHDYQPVDNVRRLRVGREAFLTFVVATNRAGIVDVTFCTAGRRVTGSLAVPGNAAGRYAEFALRLVDADVGLGGAVLRWDGPVAAAVTFAVTR